MKKAYLFAGQGQQFLHMGQDLAQEFESVSRIYEAASLQAGFDILNLNEEQLNSTEYTQAAVLTLNYAISTLIPNDAVYVAGLSLGEYNALVYAGVLSFSDALDLVLKRSKIMASALKDTGMYALLRTDIETVELAIKDLPIAVCNHNTPSQIVVGGYLKDLEASVETLKEHGIKRIVPLNVSSVSHMYLMEDASKEFEETLKQYQYKTPNVDFINNVEAKVQTDDFVSSLSRQISHRTRLSETIQLMINQGVDQFVEIGPKGSLKSCVLAHDKSLEVHSIYDLETLKESESNAS